MRTLSAVIVLAFAGTAYAQAPKGKEKDEAAIKALCASVDAAWAKGDAKALSAAFAEDATIVTPMGEMMNGRAGIEQKLGSDLAGPLKGSTHTITPTTIAFVKPDVAIGDAEIELAGAKTPDGKAMPAFKHKATAVFVKQKGKWLFSAARGYVHMPPPGAHKAPPAK